MLSFGTVDYMYYRHLFDWRSRFGPDFFAAAKCAAKILPSQRRRSMVGCAGFDDGYGMTRHHLPGGTRLDLFEGHVILRDRLFQPGVGTGYSGDLASAVEPSAGDIRL